MKITKIIIRSFGALIDREFTFSPEANLIEGANESGKTSLAVFIKFALYGLDAKKGSPTEKERYINRSTGKADGIMEFTHEGGSFRIERSVGNGVREKCELIDLETLTPVRYSGEIGEYLFGVPESVFLNTVFIRQSTGSAVDGVELKNAAANILSSGDEKISVEKALRKLDSERAKLKHKNSVGGRLRELEREMSEAEAELEDSRRSHAAVIAANAELREKQTAIEKAQDESDRIGLVLQLYDDMRAVERRSKLEAALIEAKALKARLDESASSLPAPDLLAKTAEIRARIKSAESVLERLKAQQRELGEKTTEPHTTDELVSVPAEAAALEASQKAKKTSGLIALFVGAAAIIAAACGYFFAFVSLGVPTIAVLGVLGVSLTVAGAALIGASAASRKKLNAVCERWGVSDTDELLDAIEEKRRAAQRESERERERERTSEQIEAAEKELEEAKESAIALYKANIGGDTGEMTSEEALELIEKRIAEANEAHSRIEALYRTKFGECKAMNEELRAIDFSAVDERREKYEGGNEWKSAAALDPEGRTALEKKRKFYSEKIRALETQCEQLKRIAYSSPGKTPAEIEEKLSALKREFDAGSLRLESLELAMETLERCGEDLRRDLIPGVVARASGDFAATTSGRHDRLVIDSDDFALRASGEDGVFEAALLSAGGADAAYICLRRALIPALYRREAPPAIYDESFAAIDEERASRLIALIAADDGQSLIFTCRASDAARAAALLPGSVKVIRM